MDNVLHMIGMAKRAGKPIVELGDLGDDPKMRAVGLFEHAGVAWHPGDEGMKYIGEAILDVLS